MVITNITQKHKSPARKTVFFPRFFSAFSVWRNLAFKKKNVFSVFFYFLFWIFVMQQLLAHFFTVLMMILNYNCYDNNFIDFSLNEEQQQLQERPWCNTEMKNKKNPFIIIRHMHFLFCLIKNYYIISVISA